MKKFTAILCAALMFLTLAACGNKEKNGGKNSAEIEFWSTYSTEKILSDKSASYYSEIKFEPELSVEAARAEYESAQIIMTAGTDIGEYDVKLSDLICGDKVYSAKNITLYNQKYITLNRITNGQSTAPTGDYPDALVPFSAAKRAKENKIAKGKNQGLWFEFYIPKETVAGTYTGSVEITYDSKSKTIPVSLTVRDITVSETTHSKSYFSVDAAWGVAFGELDSSVEVVRKYNTALSEYRLCGGQWPVGVTKDWIAEFGKNENDIDTWISYVWEFIKEPRNSTLALPYRYLVDHTGENIDEKILTDTVVAFSEKCIEENVNLADKLIGYYTMIDEPDMYGSAEHVKAVMDRVNAAIEKAAQIIENGEGNAELRAEIAESVRNIESVVPVGKYNEAMAESIDTWCPGTVNYDMESERLRFETDREKWWYTCVGPVYPYANYLIETSAFTPRIFDWQAEKYGITGNLYWAGNYYKSDTAGYLEDYYQTGIRTVGMNGEGFLFYPAKPYGLEKPVGSIRLQAARDGIEDKEILLALRNGYNTSSEACGYEFTADDILDSLYKKLFDGMKIQTDSARFAKVRRELLDLAEMFDGEEKFAVSKREEQNNTVTFEIVTAATCEFKVNGETAAPIATYGSGEDSVNVYSVSGSKLTASDIRITTLMNGNEKSIVLPLGGAAKEESAENWIPNAEALYGDIEIKELGSEKYAEIKFEKADAATTQRLVIGGAFLKDIGKNTDSVAFRLSANGSSDLRYSICFEYENSPIFAEIASGTLSGEIQTVTVGNVHAFPWNSGNVKKIHIYFGEQGDETRTVGVGCITVTESA